MELIGAGIQQRRVCSPRRSLVVSLSLSGLSMLQHANSQAAFLECIQFVGFNAIPSDHRN